MGREMVSPHSLLGALLRSRLLNTRLSDPKRKSWCQLVLSKCLIARDTEHYLNATTLLVHCPGFAVIWRAKFVCLHVKCEALSLGGDRCNQCGSSKVYLNRVFCERNNSARSLKTRERRIRSWQKIVKGRNNYSIPEEETSNRNGTVKEKIRMDRKEKSRTDLLHVRGT